MRKFAFVAAPLLLVSCLTADRSRMTETRIDNIMRDYAATAGPGASVLVYRDGQPVMRKSYGRSDLEAGTAASSDTNYRLASISKQFTAAAILTLSEKGLVSLDDPIRHHLPSLPAEASGATIRHLLTHTSGLIDYEDVIPDGTAAQLRDADVLRLLESQRRLYFAPGTDYRYSNSGYALLALIVEKVSGRSFATFLRDEIFIPNGMNDTVAFEEGVSLVARRAYGHSRVDSDSEGRGVRGEAAAGGRLWKRTDQSVTSAVLGDGGIYSSIDDLARWLAALDAGAFAEAMIPRVATDDPAVRYGYGWRISSHDGKPIILHTGETIGFRNALVRFPQQKLAVVVLTNRDEGEPRLLALAIAEALLCDGC